MIRRIVNALQLSIICVLTSGPASADDELIALKNETFGGLELIRACSSFACDEINIGIDLCSLCDGLPVTAPQEPLVDLVTHDMLYFNWEIPAPSVPALEATLQAAYGFSDKGFSLAPIALLDDETPRHYMSLDYYSVVIAGVVNYRSEWSTYVVREGDPKPHFWCCRSSPARTRRIRSRPASSTPRPTSPTRQAMMESTRAPMTSRRCCRHPTRTSTT
jgi:hypothetical protein